MMPLNDIPEEKLPEWMRFTMRGTDWGILLVLVVALLSGWFFIWHSELPHSHEYESYVWRVDELSEMMQAGHFYPRWSYYALNGYGAPLYHYAPPSASYVSAVIATLFTGDAVGAIRVFIVLALCFAGGTLYSLLMRLVNGRVGVLGATLYLVNPFTISTILFRTGNLDLLLTLALLPTVLWATHRWIYHATALNFTLMVMSGSGLLLTHPYFAGLSGLFIIGLAWHSRPTWRILTGLVLGALLSLSLTTFYWLPALFERDGIWWMAHVRRSTTLDLTLDNIIGLPSAIDSALVIPEIAVTLGVWLPLLGIFGGIFAYSLKVGGRFFRVSSVIGLVSIGVALASGIYEALLLSVLGFAISGGLAIQAFDWFSLQWRRIGLSGLVIMTAILAQSSWLGTEQRQSIQKPSLEAYIREVVAGYGELLIPIRGYLPVTLTAPLPANRQVIQEYLNGQNAHLFSQRAEGIQVSLVNSEGFRQRYQFRTETPIDIIVQQAYFAGWQASVNDLAVDVRRDEATGLMVISLPSTSKGELELYLGMTTIRLWSWIISWVTLTGLAFLMWRGRYEKSRYIISYKRYLPHEDARLLTSGFITGIVIVIFLMSDLGSGLLPARLQSGLGTSLQDAIRVQYRTEIGLRVIGFDVNSIQVQHGDKLAVNVWWQTSRSLNENYHARIVLRNVQNNQLVTSSHFKAIGDYPMRRWGRDATGLDRHIVDIPAGLLPGRYSLNIILIRCVSICDDTQAVFFFDQHGNSLGRSLTLPQIITIEGD